jgi:hypothetical protein
MNRYDDQVNWYQIVNEYAERERLAGPVHPTWHVGPNLYKAALEAGWLPEDLTLVTPDGMTEPGQELDMVNAAGQQTMIETFAPRTIPIPTAGAAPNDMRPKHINRTAVKAARKVARINRRKRGKR